MVSGANFTGANSSVVPRRTAELSTGQGTFAKIWACSSVVERHSDKMEVEGPIPSMPTKI